MNRLEIVRGDITTFAVDAIVNAANQSLLGGGGVDGAIHRAAGPGLLRACRLLGGCETGEAKITEGFELPAKYVIHTVGPVWHGGEYREEDRLADCYEASLKLAVQYHCETIAFPAISCGVYGFPVPLAATIAIRTIMQFLKKYPQIKKVSLVCFDAEVYRFYQQAYEKFETEHYRGAGKAVRETSNYAAQHKHQKEVKSKKYETVFDTLRQKEKPQKEKTKASKDDEKRGHGGGLFG